MNAIREWLTGIGMVALTLVALAVIVVVLVYPAWHLQTDEYVGLLILLAAVIGTPIGIRLTRK